MKNFLVLTAVVAIIISVKWSPFDYFMEAGPAAYYQARIAYTRVDAVEKSSISRAFADHKITLHEYSKTVFPAYVHTSISGEELFPKNEQVKSVEQLRAELGKEILAASAKEGNRENNRSH